MVSRTITAISLSVIAAIVTLSQPVEALPIAFVTMVLIPGCVTLIGGATFAAVRKAKGYDDKMRRDEPPPTCTIPPYLSACKWGIDSTVHKNDDNSIVIDGLPTDCHAQIANLTEAQAKEVFHVKVTVLNETAIQLSDMPKNFANEIISIAKNVV
jgi:hypothetical protein